MSFESQLLLIIISILIIGLFIIIKAIDYIKKIGMNYKNLHRDNSDKKEQKEKGIKEDIITESSIDNMENLDDKWKKKAVVIESKMNNLGETKVVNGESAKNALEIMRKMKNNQEND